MLIEYVFRNLFVLRKYVRMNRKGGGRALRGYFGPLRGQNMKIACHKFLLISLLKQ